MANNSMLFISSLVQLANVSLLQSNRNICPSMPVISVFKTIITISSNVNNLIKSITRVTTNVYTDTKMKPIWCQLELMTSMIINIILATIST